MKNDIFKRDHSDKIRIGIPKGSLTKSTVDLFEQAGYSISIDSRSYFPKINDSYLVPVLVRAQEMARYVENGALDVGITGKDWLLENQADVHCVTNLVYGKSDYQPIRWVLAVPEKSPFSKVQDLEGKKIATELVNVTKKYLKKNRVSADVEFSWGATEVKAPHLADAIVELTETGISLIANRLKIIDTVVESTTQLIVNKTSYKDSFKKNKIDNLSLLLKGALLAKFKVGLKMNLHKDSLDNVLKMIEGLKVATLSQLVEKEWFAIDVIVDESLVRTLVPNLVRLGACDIVEYPLKKVVL